MTESENLKKLMKFCNNLGKAFRKLVEETEETKIKFLKDIRNLEIKIDQLETDLKSDKEETNERIKSSLSHQHRDFEDKIDQINLQISEDRAEFVKVDKKVKLTPKERNKDSYSLFNIKTQIEAIDKKLVHFDDEIKRLETDIYTKRTSYTTDKNINRARPKCDKCDHKFNSLNELEDHMTTRHEGWIKSCPKCGKDFYSKLRLKYHIEGHQVKRRRCHYYNNGKDCPFDKLGCKFDHAFSKNCREGLSCEARMC